MPRITTAFAVEVFDRRNAGTGRLADFIAIYVRHFGHEHRTSSNELLKFLASPPANVSIFYFGLTYRDCPCGFATLMIYPEGPIGVVDHLVIAPNSRGYGGFFVFCDLISEYVDKRKLKFDHLIAEIVLGDESTASTLKPTHMLRLMRLIGFKVARLNYWAPDPLIVRHADRAKAILLLLSLPERNLIASDELLRLIRIVYRVHYLGWYARIMQAPDYAAYRDKAEELLKAIEVLATKQRDIKLNGLKNFDLSYISGPSAPLGFSNIFYIGMIAVPATVGVSVGVAQERWVSVVTALSTALAIALFAFHRRLRGVLKRAFRVEE